MSKKKKPRSKKDLRLKRTILLVLTYGSVCYGLFFIYDFFFNLPDVKVVKDHYPIIQSLDQKKFEKEKPKNWVDVKTIPKKVYGAFIVSEDWEFFHHQGFDLPQMQGALLEDLKTGSFKRGGSTITQQVVKNLFLNQEKSLIRKYKELVLSTELEETYDKYKILELYLNIAEMGQGIFGIELAAQFYFKKHAKDLRPKEAAFIAMLLPSPKRYSVSFRKKELTKYAARIVDSILTKMEKGGFISEEMLNAELSTPLGFEKMPEPLPDISGETPSEQIEQSEITL